MNRRQRRQAGRHPITDKRVSDLTSPELHAQLITDAVTGVATPLPWAVAAYDRIGKLDRIGPEAAYQRVRQEILSLGAPMPGAPGQ